MILTIFYKRKITEQTDCWNLGSCLDANKTQTSCFWFSFVQIFKETSGVYQLLKANHEKPFPSNLCQVCGITPPLCCWSSCAITTRGYGG